MENDDYDLRFWNRLCVWSGIAVAMCMIISALFLSSCKSKEIEMKKDIIEVQKCQETAKDSVVKKMDVVKNDSNSENVVENIKEWIYDTSKKDSVGGYPLMKYREISRNSRKEMISKRNERSDERMISISVKKMDKKITDKESSKVKEVQEVKSVSHLVRNIWILIIVLSAVVLCVVYRKQIVSVVSCIIGYLKRKG